MYNSTRKPDWVVHNCLWFACLVVWAVVGYLYWPDFGLTLIWSAVANLVLLVLDFILLAVIEDNKPYLFLRRVVIHIATTPWRFLKRQWKLFRKKLRPKSLGHKPTPPSAPTPVVVAPSPTKKAPTSPKAAPTMRTKPVVERRVDLDDRDQPITTSPILRRNLGVVQMGRHELSGLKKIGEGGEAVVYTDGKRALKVFRQPDDEWYIGDGPDAKRMREQAEERLRLYLEKLPQFPIWMGPHQIGPTELVCFDKKYPVGAYWMPLVKDGVPLRNYTKRKWKRKQNVDVEAIGRVFLDLYDALAELHACGMLVGDFKPDNILVSNGKVKFVDAESMAYGPYRCHTYSEGYVDPQLCDPRADYEVLVKPYSRSSDWYAFTVMLFQCVANLHPYEGAYTPSSGQRPVPPARRSLERISVFNKNVKVPNFTQNISTLPKGLQHFFFNVFEKGLRERPDRSLIEALINEAVDPFCAVKDTCWVNFGMEDGDEPLELPVEELTSVYAGTGELLSARVFGGQVHYLVREGCEIVDHDGNTVLEVEGDEYNTFMACKTGFVFGTDHDNTSVEQKDGPFIYVPPKAQPERIAAVDPAPDGSPNLCKFGKRLFYINDGRLRATDKKRSFARFKGTAHLFGGERFGIVLRTEEGEFGNLFLLKRSTLTRLTALPPIMGTITDVECHFSHDHVWVFLTADWQGTHSRYILILDDNGNLRGMTCVSAEVGQWHSSGIPKTANEEEIDGKLKPVLASLTADLIVRVMPGKAKLKILSTQPWTSDREPTLLIATVNGLRAGFKALPQPESVAPSDQGGEEGEVSNEMEETIPDDEGTDAAPVTEEVPEETATSSEEPTPESEPEAPAPPSRHEVADIEMGDKLKPLC